LILKNDFIAIVESFPRDPSKASKQYGERFSCGSHQHTDVIADEVFEEDSSQTEAGFEMADDRRLWRINCKKEFYEYKRPA